MSYRPFWAQSPEVKFLDFPRSPLPRVQKHLSRNLASLSPGKGEAKPEIRSPHPPLSLRPPPSPLAFQRVSLLVGPPPPSGCCTPGHFAIPSPHSQKSNLPPTPAPAGLKGKSTLKVPSICLGRRGGERRAPGEATQVLSVNLLATHIWDQRLHGLVSDLGWGWKAKVNPLSWCLEERSLPVARGCLVGGRSASKTPGVEKKAGSGVQPLPKIKL